MNMHQWNILHKYVSCVGFLSIHVKLFTPTSNDGTDASDNIGDDGQDLDLDSGSLLLSDNCAEIDWNPASNTILDSSNININVQLKSYIFE